MNIRESIIFDLCLIFLIGSVTAFAQQPELVVQTGHAEVISSMSFSPDGKSLASGSLDGTIKLWEVSSGLLLRTLDERAQSSGASGLQIRTFLAFSPDGKLLASGGRDRTIKLWDAATGKVVRQIAGLAADITAFAFSPDGKTLVSGGQDKLVKLWDAATGQEIATLRGHSAAIFTIAFAQDGKTLVSGDWEGKIKFWGIDTRRELRTITEHASTLSAIALSPDGKVLGVGLQDRTIKLWEAATGKLLRKLSPHEGPISSVAFSPDGKLLASGSQDKTIRLREVASGRLLLTVTGHQSEISSIAFSPDGKSLASGGWDSQIKLWGLDGNPLRTLAGFSFYIRSVAFSPDGQMIASASQDHSIKLWRATAGNEFTPLIGHTAEVTSVTFGAEGQLLASGAKDGTARLWNVSDLRPLRTFTGHSDWVLSVAISPDGRVLASGSVDRTIKLWAAESGTLLRTLVGHTSDVTSVAFSPDGRTLVSGSVDQTVRLWNVASGTPIRTLAGHTSFVNSVAYSPVGNTVASGSVDRMVKLWDVASGLLLRTLTGHSNAVYCVAFSPDGSTLASSGWDQTIRLWDVSSGREVRSLAGHSSNISSIAFSPGGRFLASGSLDTKVNLWDVTGGKELGSLIALDRKEWAVVTREGRFDASAEGMKLMHWMVGGEPIILSQLKGRYYEPGLLGKLLGVNPEPLREVAAFKDIKLFPEVQFDPIVPGSNKVTLKVINRGGGIGRIQAYVNNKEIMEDARPPETRPDASDVVVTLDLSDAPAIPSQQNTLRIVPWNAEGYLSSRGVKASYTPSGPADPAPPELYAIVAGISAYSSPTIALNFAGKDAVDFATALELGAKRLFGVGKVHLTLLTTAPDPRAIPPTKENLLKAFEEAKKGKTKDVLLVYLAGHGVALQQGNDTYCYLTHEARDLQSVITDPEIRARAAITNDELFQLLKVRANKQVVILDTCAAGAAVTKFLEKRAVSGDTVRALERLKDRAGSHVLMGSAADAVSYEASQYGQGVLTYALLQGMKGEALREGEFVDVSQLFQYARDTVPQLARNIGGIQKPKYYAPEAESFDVGQLMNEDKEKIVLAKLKPLILRPTISNREDGVDDLEISEALRQQLKERCQEGAGKNPKEVSSLYLDSKDHPDGVAVNGAYTVTGRQINLTLTLLYRKQRLKAIALAGSKDQLEQLIVVTTTEILKSVRELWLDGKLS